MILKLIVKRGPKRIKEITFRGKTLNIGSGKGNGLVLKGEGVAKNHCSIIRGEKGYYILSNESPAIVNGMRIEERDLLEGDIINVGEYTIISYFIDESQIYGYLVAVDGPLKGRRFLITSSCTVGRASSNDIVIDEPSISKQHFRIIIKGENIYIEDMGSRNRTILNNKVIEKGMLKQGDRLKVGDTTLLFLKNDNPYIRLLYNRMFKIYIAIGIVVVSLIAIGGLQFARKIRLENFHKTHPSREKQSIRENELNQIKEWISDARYNVENGYFDDAEDVIKKIKNSNIDKAVYKDTIKAIEERIQEEKKKREMMKRIEGYQDKMDIKSFFAAVDSALHLGIHPHKLYELSKGLGDRLLDKARAKDAHNVYKRTKQLFTDRLSKDEVAELDSYINMTKPGAPIFTHHIPIPPETLLNQVSDLMKKGENAFSDGQVYDKDQNNAKNAEQKYREALNDYEEAYKLLENYSKYPLAKEIKEKIKEVKQAIKGL